MATTQPTAAIKSGLAISDQGTEYHRVMQAAWYIWSALLLAPFMLFLMVTWFIAGNDRPMHQSFGYEFFIFNCIYLALAVPVSFGLRSKMFASYYEGKGVPPRRWLVGMMIPWIAFELAGIFSLIGAIVDNTLLPNLIPALLAFVLFCTQWPKGTGMLRPTGDSEDSGLYEEPR